MNEIAKQNGNAVAANVRGNYFQDYGEQVSQRSIIGKLLKFSKGDYLVGQDNEELAPGKQFVANMDELMVGWIRWSDNKPTDQIMGRISQGYQPPKRHTLGDDDKTQWEIDDQNQERDPWQFSNYLLLKEAGKDDIYTFTTSSKGGLGAIAELCKTYGSAMRQHPDELPIITLNVDSYQHSNRAFGRIKFPKLTLVGWAPRAEFEAALATEGASDGQDAAAVNEPKPAKAAAKPAAKPAETRF